MRPTTVRSSGMPEAKAYNPWWGDTCNLKQKGVITYTLSPYRQRPTKQIFQDWMFNGYKRLAAQVPYWIVPFAIAYGTYTWAKRYDAWQNSKAGHIALHGTH
ncbi:cytochrome b-c1 complex subunit 8 [Butyriboletus roseoflavus]|nr:cytochrome b-c1 complex subunit 8 [Butyriboletus roseoflavus]